MSFERSSRFETWVSKLRIAWNDASGVAILGAKAALLGDRMVDRAREAVHEAMPTLGSDAGRAHVGSDRLLPIGDTESQADYGERLTAWIAQWGLAGSPLGLLIQLWYQGYEDCVYVQQNGRAVQLNGAPDLDNLIGGSPLTNTDLSVLIAPMTSDVEPSRTPIPTGTPWWVFDSDIWRGNRYALLLPSQPSFFLHTAEYQFVSGGGTARGVPWVPIFPAGTTVRYMTGPARGANVRTWIDYSDNEGVVLNISSSADCLVQAIAWADGDHPMVSPNPDRIATLRRIIKLWNPRKAKCMGIFALAQGTEFWGWPIGTWGDTGNWGYSEVVKIDAEE